MVLCSRNGIGIPSINNYNLFMILTCYSFSHNIFVWYLLWDSAFSFHKTKSVKLVLV